MIIFDLKKIKNVICVWKADVINPLARREEVKLYKTLNLSLLQSISEISKEHFGAGNYNIAEKYYAELIFANGSYLLVANKKEDLEKATASIISSCKKGK